MVLQEDWKVQVVGDIYTDEDGDSVIDVEVTLPGIKWYYMEENTQEDLDYYYEGSVLGFANSVESYYQDYFGKYTMDELFYSGAEPQPSIAVYNDGMETTIYVVELDENCKLTGRYGATVVTLPELIIPEPEVEILGPITKHEAWTAEYLGRYEYDDSGYVFMAPRKAKKTLHINIR